MELLTQAVPAEANRFGIYNGIDELAADPRSFDTQEEAEAVLKSFKRRFIHQGFYRSNQGYHLPLTSLDADGEGGGVFVVNRNHNPEVFDCYFWA
ncbi:MAG TPA: hypothetical protein VFC44_21015 [Candidatus Saccharimonadales bacterium]|nr:hypothetical protein [Candidatus Saccharimonadales bacterium]